MSAMESSEGNYKFSNGDKVKFESFALVFNGTVLGEVLKLDNVYYVKSQKGEVRMFAGSALIRI